MAIAGDLTSSPTRPTRLTLRNTSISVASLRYIARACPGLKTFCAHYEYLPSWSEGPITHFAPLPPAQILNALQPLSPTLEKLDLDGRIFDEFGNDVPKELSPPDMNNLFASTARLPQRIKSMERFPALVLLGINYGVVERADTNVLIELIERCETLRALIIYDASTIFRQDLLSFAEAVSYLAFPLLRKVTLISNCSLHVPPRPRATRGVHLPNDGCHVPHRYNVRMWQTLKRPARDPVPQPPHDGNVELILQPGCTYLEVRAKLFVEMEKELDGCWE